MQYFYARIEDHPQSLQCLEVCNNAIYDLDEKVRGCYSEKIDHIDKNVLAEIMLLDGCFILELFLSYDQYLNMKLEDESDPIFNSAWMIAALRHDLILLENQILFFILKSLYDAMKSHLKGIPRPEQAAAANIKTWGFNFSASNLLRAGIEFEEGLSEDHLLNITFVKGI
ncbi:unnamed protein product [Prunus armeniaca]